MIDYPKAPDDDDRVAFLRSLAILDTGPDPVLDTIACLAADALGAPMAAMPLLDEDRQWYRASCGVEVPETPRDLAFCNVTILQPRLLDVPDTLKDARFARHPLVIGAPNLRSYAGMPIMVDGHAVGTLCVFDTRARDPLTPSQSRVLRGLARLAERQVLASRTMREVLAILATTVAGTVSEPPGAPRARP